MRFVPRFGSNARSLRHARVCDDSTRTRSRNFLFLRVSRARLSSVEGAKRKKYETSLRATKRAYFLYSLPFSIFATWFASLNTIGALRYVYREIHRLTFSSYRDSIDGGTKETVVEFLFARSLSQRGPFDRSSSSRFHRDRRIDRILFSLGS